MYVHTGIMSWRGSWYGRVIQILYKLIGLPDFEMNRGQEHANKVGDSYDDYELLQNNQYMLNKPWLSKDSRNSVFSINRCGFTFLKSGQSFENCIVETDIKKSDKSSAKYWNTHNRSTSGLPKGGNTYGNGATILLSHPSFKCERKGLQNCRTYKTDAADKTISFFESGAKFISTIKRDDKGCYSRLYQLLCSKNLLLAAYNKIKSNTGNLTPGSDGETLDGISIKLFDKLIQELKLESFKFTSIKQVYIPNKNGNMRPIGIPNVKDKIVQQSMLLLLEQIYEPIFSDFSHGFRPKRNPHSALREISNWNGTTWAIEGDIKGFCDNINHKKLIQLLSMRIKDQQFIDLVWKLLRAGYLEKNIFKVSSLISCLNIKIEGVPQIFGGIISPMLSNIYLHELDKFMENIIETRSSKSLNVSKVNPKLIWYSENLAKLNGKNKKYPINKDKNILQEIKRLNLERVKMPSQICTEVRIRYVRYADNWVVGIRGPKTLAVKLKQEISAFLKENLLLDLSQEKTLITHLNTKKANFLGVNFSMGLIKSQHVSSNFNPSKIQFHIPTKKILDSLVEKGFIKYKDRKGKKLKVPNAITKWIFLDHRSIILRYNSVITGIYNYYSFIDNTTQFLSIINFFLVHSCAKTLARKFNLPSRAAAFHKFGPTLSAPAVKDSKIKPLGLSVRTSNKRITKGLDKAKPLTYDPLES